MAISCTVLTNKDRELLKDLPEENEETLKGLVGIWMERNPNRETDHPTLEQIKSLITELRGPEAKPLISAPIEPFGGTWTRRDAQKDPTSLYIFTDNTDRDSGKTLIDPMSKYAQRYGQNKHFPTMTQAVLRGLDNAMPISTQRWYHDGAKGVTGRWTDADFDEFKKVIDEEVNDIIEEWKSGKYKRIVIADSDGFFNTEISNISKERTPRLYDYLQSKLAQLGIKPVESQESGESALAPSEEQTYVIQYTPKGKTRQTYTIKGSQIFNKNNKEVFAKESADRLRIFANLAIRQKRAVVVNYRDKVYVVNSRGQILSGTSGKIMKWGEENGDRKAILADAQQKFAAMMPTAPTVVPTNTSTPINIYYGTGENAHLSNFAERPFTVIYTPDEPIAPIEGNFKTVEGAFQAQKLAYSSMPEQEQEAIRKQLENASGSEARRIGRSIKGLDTRKWDELSSSLMKNLILASFEQNPQALQQLLATGNAELTHTQDKGKWGKEFPKLLMEVRGELSSNEASAILRSTKPSTTFSVSSSTSYPVRTRENAEWSDITIALAEDFSTAGERLTQRVAGTKYVSHSLSSSNNPQAIADSIYDQIASKGKVKDLKLNIAGNGIYTLNQPQEYYNNLLTEVLSILQSKGVTISAIRSGGQTGIDEAGIIAAQRLGIPSIVHTTSDFKFRGKDNKDISDEARFKNRFSQQSAEEMLDDALLPQSPTTEEGTSSDDTSFETIPVTTLAEQRAVDLEFDPQVRRDRVTLISRLFSNEVDAALKEAKDNISRRLVEEKLTEKQKAQLRDDLYSLNRYKIIKALTPGGIFNRIKEGVFGAYIKDTDKGRINAELAKINATKGAEKFSDEKKLEAATKRAEHKFQEYQKVIEHFQPLAEEASGLLLITEGVRVDPNYVSPDAGNLSDDTPEGEDVGENPEDPNNTHSKEESYKDGWMTNFRQVSSFSSLSQAVRKVIRETPKLNYKGKRELDDLGNYRYFDADFVHATLIDKLRYMTTASDMVPLLEDLARLKPWVKQILKIINNDEILFSQFYQDFRKDFVEYWIQKKRMNNDGTFTIETIPVNKPEGTYYLLDSWRDNYESGTVLDEDSIYSESGEISKENAAKGLELVEKLNNELSNLTTQERLDFLEKEENWNTLLKILNMVGINPNPAVLRLAVFNIKEIEGAEVTDPIMLILPQLNVIFSKTIKGELNPKIEENGTVTKKDLINTFSGAYNEIATALSEVTEDAIESSIRENERSYYSHVNPSYLGRLIKNLKNVMNDEERFNRFIQDQFGQYEWFYDSKRNIWLNDWIEKLATDPSMRKVLQHKVLLNHDKRTYTDWDDLDGTIILLNEFWANPKKDTAWYYVPMLSDSPSAEFIKFVRYTNGVNKDGKDVTYQEQILDKLENLVIQEYNRIQLVKERYDRRMRGENISPIANFDIIGDRKGGSEFKFLPALNNMKFKNGETFLDRFERLREGSPSEFKKFLRGALNYVMEEGFEQTYEEWDEIGLFEELKNGKFKHIPFQGQSQTNQRVARALNDAKSILGNLFTEDMQDLLTKYANNKPVRDKKANKVFDEIRSLLSEKEAKGEVDPRDTAAISRNLTTKNNSKEALREYYWNSKFATSQIIQLTTTDLAFYKDLEDFQKRYKEVHAPSLRLNTLAKFHGELIGREWERTLYLKDDEIMSSVAKDIEEIFLDKYNKKEISAFDAANVIAKFGLSNVKGENGKEYYKVGDVMIETSKVNVADAQALRSLSSYRAMLGMQGKWTDEMETAYQHLRDGTWTMDDFNVIWQTVKPYLYTQINNDSGIEGHTGIKTPVQHKNSEFLLLAIYSAIAGPLGRSDKLRAINDFMEDHNIDVVQFESTTKVGKV